VADRLWARVDRTDSGCWLWTGGRSTARNGFRRSAMGMRHWKAKLTDDDVAEIRRRFTGRRGEQTQLAHAFGISTAHVHRILVGTSRRVA